MLPIRTVDNPTRKPSYLTYGLIAANVLLFLFQATLTQDQLNSMFRNLAAVPCELWQSPASLESGLDIVRGMFLHSSWPHLLGNLLYLWIFGTVLEDRLGRRTFLLMFLGCGVVASLLQSVLYQALCVPLVGASGAIAGILGAFLVLNPRSRVRVGLISLQILKVPASIVLVYWFILQLFNGFASLGVDTLSSGGVAFFAHIGGFIAGLVAALALTRITPAPRIPTTA